MQLFHVYCQGIDNSSWQGLITTIPLGLSPFPKFQLPFPKFQLPFPKFQLNR